MDKLINICLKGLQQKNLLQSEYKDRFKLELTEIKRKDEAQYFLDIYDNVMRLRESGTPIVLDNENNLIIPYLMGICDSFDINESPSRTPIELPDIDVDFISIVRKYLKVEWAPKEFGSEYVANIGTYTTYDIKNSLIDMTRVFNQDHREVLKITKQMDTKDNEGEHLTWDKAIEIYPAFKAYVAKHPDVADAAQRLCHRNRGMGTHAGGLIISDRPLSDFAPTVLGKDQIQTSWVEGLASQDLQAVGLIKFDLLVITNLMQIALCTKLIKERHNVDSVCSLQGRGDWSDTSYLNDPKSIKMANKGDLVCIFQYDSPGIRQLVRDGGVDSFNDLSAYSALYRPGPLSMKMHTAYCNRKNGKEAYETHPLIAPITKDTYNVLVFQEQILKILNIVGDIPQDDCESVRKAISKKKIKDFIKYKEMFVRNGGRKLGYSEEEMNNLWDQIEAFAGYGFNESHSVAYAYVSARLLYLKSHYSEEFYTAVLSCVSGVDKYEKLREYKREANKHDVVINRLDLNKSKENFSIGEDGRVYYGFSVVKGIGEEVAKKIVEGQPYSGFEDFLIRFGTDAKVIQALVALNIFSDNDPVNLWKFYEFFKSTINKRADRQKRYLKSMENYKIKIEGYEKEIDSLTKECMDAQEINGLSKDFQIAHDKLMSIEKELDKTKKRKCKSTSSFEAKEKQADKTPVNFGDFKPEIYIIDKEVEDLLEDREKSDLAFYGFLWTHPLENCSNYGGYTFDTYKSADAKVGIVDVLLTEVTKKYTKKDMVYYGLRVQDCDCVEGSITIWDDDYEIFKNDLQVGNLIRLRLKNPFGGFSSYTLDGPPRYLRHTLPPPNQDYRIVRLDIDLPDKPIEEVVDFKKFNSARDLAVILINSDMILDLEE